MDDRKAIADEFRAVPVEGDRELPEWLDKALDVGVYPASGPGDRVRTPYEDGYNAAVIEITERVEIAYAAVSLTGSGLDVERLARALDLGLALGQPWTSDVVPYHDFLLACAADIAREYAALSGESGEPNFAPFHGPPYNGPYRVGESGEPKEDEG